MTKFDYYITGTIGVAYDWWTGQKGTTSNQVKSFLDNHKDEELTIAVSSPGGYLDDGITIGEYIHAHGKCNMVIVGMTASAATVLCMKAKSVKIAKGSMMLVHNSSITLNVWTSVNKHGADDVIKQFQKARADLDTFDKAIAEIYSTRNGRTMEENLSLMDEERWMLAREALKNGLVDGIIEDEEAAAHSTAIKNSYSSVAGLSEHFGLPAVPLTKEDNTLHRGFRNRISGLVDELRSLVVGEEKPVTVDEAYIPNQQNNISTMKKKILNFVCAAIALTDITINDDGQAVLTEAQLDSLEASMKEKDDARQTAEMAKATAEQKLQELQKEFDEFKAEAGAISSPKPAMEEKNEAASALDLFKEIKNLI